MAMVIAASTVAACSEDTRVDRFYGTDAGANFELPEAAALDALPNDAGATTNGGGDSTDAASVTTDAAGSGT